MIQDSKSHLSESEGQVLATCVDALKQDDWHPCWTPALGKGGTVSWSTRRTGPRTCVTHCGSATPWEVSTAEKNEGRPGPGDRLTDAVGECL